MYHTIILILYMLQNKKMEVEKVEILHKILDIFVNKM